MSRKLKPARERHQSAGPTGSPRFHKRLRLWSWSALNLSRSGVSVTLGRRGPKLNLGRRGLFVTLGLPGSGFSYRWRLTWSWLRNRLAAGQAGGFRVNRHADRQARRAPIEDDAAPRP